MKILIVEDERKLAGYMEKGLKQAGYLTTVCHDGAAALEQAAIEEFDLILLDLMLPSTNGFEVLKNLRAFNINVPVIIVSALSDTRQIVEGLDLGAVDYIKKPFDWEELLARIRTVQRIAGNTKNSTLMIDDLCIDFAARKVLRGDKEINLTTKEYLLLECLAKNANRVLSKNQLLENAWEMNFDPESNIIEVYMHQLRKKIDKDFDNPIIKTVVGAGYMLKGDKKSM
ncbi:response regulator transcription factor [Chitinophaga silvisoli]|uniref:DNA-binding response regulator n=1 Tax=Chitinophaga silvisoli TaxID=2291814 RepID=A0A3E1NSM6_9BACT|nr:response regulator transcription factor [Chitinophaga silvisoli]RFM30912.1 DNA-binding response regulator [Chitinophaga silvisoli]